MDPKDFYAVSMILVATSFFLSVVLCFNSTIAKIRNYLFDYSTTLVFIFAFLLIINRYWEMFFEKLPQQDDWLVVVAIILAFFVTSALWCFKLTKRGKFSP
jgi:hypothetical protein